MTTDRDPRRDPQAGDVLTKGSRTRRVRYCCLGGMHITYWTKSGGERSCELATWRRLAKGAEVQW